MMSPAGSRHGIIAMRIGGWLMQFIYDNDFGEVAAAETGFRIESNPDTVRAPDVAFISKDRVPLISETGFFPGAPDLAVAVLSPDDSASDVLQKVQDWLSHGAEQVWVADPKHRTISVYRASEAVMVFGEDEMLRAGGCVEGFEVRVADVFR